MNTEELRKIEAFRQRLEIRFQYERRVKRLKVVLGVLVASTLAISLPLFINAQLSHGTPESAPVAPDPQPATRTTGAITTPETATETTMETAAKTAKATVKSTTDSPPAARP
ncbi:hypothetical protein [Trichothermofontia sp.]